MKKNWDYETSAKEAQWCFGDKIGSRIYSFIDSESDDCHSDSGSSPDSTIFTPSISDRGGVALDVNLNPVDILLRTVQQLEIDEDKSNGFDRNKRQRRAEAYEVDFEILLGTDPKRLDNWQNLCKILNIEPVPQSITQCKKVSAVDNFIETYLTIYI